MKDKIEAIIEELEILIKDKYLEPWDAVEATLIALREVVEDEDE